MERFHATQEELQSTIEAQREEGERRKERESALEAEVGLLRTREQELRDSLGAVGSRDEEVKTLRAQSEALQHRNKELEDQMQVLVGEIASGREGKVE